MRTYLFRLSLLWCRNCFVSNLPSFTILDCYWPALHWWLQIQRWILNLIWNWHHTATLSSSYLPPWLLLPDFRHARWFEIRNKYTGRILGFDVPLGLGLQLKIEDHNVGLLLTISPLKVSGPISVIFLIGHLYLSDLWLSVDRRKGQNDHDWYAKRDRITCTFQNWLIIIRSTNR